MPGITGRNGNNMKPNPKEKIIPLSQAAQRFGLQHDTVRKKIIACEITGAFRIKNRWYFTEESLNKAVSKYRWNQTEEQAI